MAGVEGHSRARRIFLTLIIVTALATVGNGYLETTKMENAKKEIVKLQAEVGSPQKLRADVSRVRNEIVENRLLVQHLEMNISTRDYIPTMLGELQTLGEASGLHVTGVRPMPKKIAPKPVTDKDKAEGDKGKDGAPKDAKPKEVKKPYDELDIEVEASGHYQDVISFLKKLGTFPKIIAVRFLTVNTHQEIGQSGPPSLEVKFGVRAYIFPTRPTTMAANAGRTQEASGGG